MKIAYKIHKIKCNINFNFCLIQRKDCLQKAGAIFSKNFYILSPKDGCVSCSEELLNNELKSGSLPFSSTSMFE